MRAVITCGNCYMHLVTEYIKYGTKDSSELKNSEG